MGIIKPCKHCHRPYFGVIICRWCGKEIDGIKTDTLLWIMFGLILLGFIVGVLVGIR